MKRIFKLPESNLKALYEENQRLLERTFTGRLINALKFLIIAIFLILWITFFLFVKENLITGNPNENVFTNLTCITFFGGLVISLFLGSLSGDIVRRAIWKQIIKKKI